MDELLLRQMPHSTEAEQAVLGSMLIDAACVKDVMDQLQPDDFYLRQNREIFETIYTMFVYSRPIDGLTVAGELEKAGLANDGTRAYLAQLMEVTPTSANVLEYVRLVREKALLRSVAAAAAEITAMVQEGTGAPGDVLEAAEQKIYAIRRGRSAQSMATIQVVLQEVMEHLAELSAQGGKTLPGLSTGFSAVDGQRPARSFHRSQGPGCPDQRPQQVRSGAGGRPSRHGQDQYGSERSPERRQGVRPDGGRLFSGDVP